MDVVEQQTENLELHTNALQILLGEPSTSALSDGLFKAFAPSFSPLHSAQPSLSGLKPMT